MVTAALHIIVYSPLFFYSGADPTIEDNAGYYPNDYCTNQIVKDLLAKYAVKVINKIYMNKGR